ncbi:GerW family sporulation protein [Bacillus sp. RO1]|uniref:GerW family sporulation protein n=1 Tax=Bacillus sp. RO1 TaxID=2722703 RepID=UPI0014570A09|nr:GerW family sporulation protein [Bacillus sp. RO1]NLP51984.1 sporulation protein YtfJ [Bacillus sp. RO1]
MSEHPIKSLMTTAMENLKDMIDVNTIIGDPVETPDGSVILTVSKVGFGFAAGGSEFQGGSSSGPERHDGGGNQQSQGHKLPFGGGSGGGVSITPIAFLIVNSQGVKMLHLDESTSIYERLLDLAPQAVEKVQQMLNNNKQNSGNHSDHSYNNHKQDLDF